MRAFVPSLGVGEDPETGSLNAGLPKWLAGSARLASQGTVLDAPAGYTHTIVRGSVTV